ncbi:MAG TPA: short-chain dehydrogenase [Solibacterales bacterium]|jgi:NAD(P)-dependent dehydrogenase (short-subunit alcohol dehydrogenase family)|nr:short-chain dehydrogenase [Bryobacterales bacterium]
MQSILTGKTAVITGGTRGIGRAIAERLLQEGAKVAICGRDAGGVEQAVEQMQPLGAISGFRADVADHAQAAAFIEDAAARHGGIDILVNNAGKGIFRAMEQLTPEEWRSMIELNLNGTFYCCHAALPHLKKSDAAYIFNISSLAGKNPFKGGSGYNASKFGVEGFTEAMMLDHRGDGIRVTTIMPGSVDTGFGVVPGQPDKGHEWKIAPGDIASVIVNLLQLPRRTLVSRVEMRPAFPPK